MVNTKDRLIVALDVSEARQALDLIRKLGDMVTFYKINHQLLLTGGGIILIESLAALGAKVMLDLKLHDIPITVTRAVEQASDLGITFLTIHAYPQTMKAAVKGRRNGLKLLAVTVLTSYDDEDLMDAGYAAGVKYTVAIRAGQAFDAGIDGLVCSPQEVPSIRQGLGNKLILVTPGIRFEPVEDDDQKRSVTLSKDPPQTQSQFLGDHIVVGRPITEAVDPQLAVHTILSLFPPSNDKSP